MGHLLTSLSDTFDGSPISEQTLRNIIESPFHDQLVARDETGTIIGMLTVSITIGAGVHRGAWLEDFVVDQSTQGTGVGSKLWDVLLEWCRSHDAHKLDFTSRPTKVAAQQFYLKRGAVVRDTNYFRVTIA
jgi:ribosomal protein S18 acetylase RimI-like enzyme